MAGKGVVSFQATYDKVAWIGVGFSGTGLMVAPSGPQSHCALCIPANATASGPYLINGTTADAFVPIHGAGAVRNVTCYTNATHTMLFFEQAYSNGGTLAAMNASGPTNLIFAAGTDATFTTAGPNMGSKSVDLSSLRHTVELATGLHFQWWDDGDVNMVTTLAGRGWVGLGVSVGGLMVDTPKSNCVICTPTNTTIATGEYSIVSSSALGFEPFSTPRPATGIACQQNATHTVLSFRRPYNNSVPALAQLNTSGPTSIIYAVGTDNNFADVDWSRMGATKIDFNTAPPSPVPPTPAPLPSMAGYQALAPGFELSWVSVEGALQFVANYTGKAWIAVGISAAGKMVGSPASNAVIYKPEEGTVEQYIINSYTSSGIAMQPTPKTCYNFSGSSVGHGATIHTIMRWTRTLDNGDATMAQLVADGVNQIIYAAGPTTNWTSDVPNVMGVSKLSFMPNHSAQFNEEYSMTWQEDPVHGEVTITCILRRMAWAAVGISKDGLMVGSDAFIFRADGAISLREYTLGGTDTSDIKPLDRSTIIVNQVNQNNSFTMFTFTRKLAAQESDQLSFNANGLTTIIWAYGVDNTWRQHTAQGAIKVQPKCAAVYHCAP